MKKPTLILSLCLSFGLLFAQNQEATDLHYRVIKEYDENGKMIRYDSTKITNTPHSKHFKFRFKMDSLLLSCPSDSIFKNKLHHLKGRAIYLDSMFKGKDFSMEHFKWFKNKDSDFFLDFHDLKERMECFDSLMEKNLHRFEKLFEKLEHSEKQKT
jgi:hypothetical protein